MCLLACVRAVMSSVFHVSVAEAKPVPCFASLCSPVVLCSSFLLLLLLVGQTIIGSCYDFVVKFALMQTKFIFVDFEHYTIGLRAVITEQVNKYC